MSRIDPASTRPLFELYRAGDYGKLAGEARSLLVEHPHETVLHTLLGAACLELGDYDAAMASYRAALAIRPGFAKAHNSLGIACLRAGRLGEAADSFRRAIDNDARFAEPRFNLGIVCENGRRLSEAAEQYEQAVALEPRYAKAWSALANVRWELGEYDQVEAHHRRALAVDPGYLPAHRGLTQFLQQSNRLRGLREAAADAKAALGAGHPLIRYQEGVLAAADGDDQAARALLEGCKFETDNVSDIHDERMRLTQLTGVCDRLDDCRGAMRYAAHANRLSSELSARKGVDKTGFLDFVENRKRYFQRHNIRRWRLEQGGFRGGSPGSHRIEGKAATSMDTCPPTATERANASSPVFVIGFPRSGTTLIDSMLRGHPRIEVAEECDAVPALVNRLSGVADAGLESLGALSQSDIDAARAGYYDRLARHVQPSAETATIIDRFALNTVYAGEIHRVFPEAKFIFMLRHPADCVLSCYLRAFIETSANASFHSLEEAATLYTKVLGLWVQYTEVFELDAVEVKYENLVRNVEHACRPVLEFLGLPWHPCMLDHERTARNRAYIRTASYNQVIRPLYSRACGRWLRYREYLDPVLPILEPWIERFGYAEIGRVLTGPA